MRAFIRDLGTILDSTSEGLEETRTLTMTTLTGVTNSWKADADYHVTGYEYIGNTGNGWQVSTDATSRFIGGVTENTLDTVILGGRSANQFFAVAMSGLRIPIPEGTRIYFINGTAATQTVVLYLAKTLPRG